MPSIREHVSEVRAIELAAELRALRQDARQTLEQVHRETGLNIGSISKMERNLIPVTPKSLKALLDHYGVHGGRRTSLENLLTNTSGVRPWWVDYADLLGPTYISHLALEAEAHLIEEHSGNVFPLHAQRDRYGRQIIANAWEVPSDDDADLFMEVRRHRQQRLLGSPPLALHSVFSEAALHSAEDLEILADQLRHMIELAELETVTFQMTPFATGRRGIVAAPVLRLSFAEQGSPKFVVSEGLVANNVRESERESRRFDRAFSRLLGAALSPDDTVAALEARLKEIA
ncbi:transcriptional regulator with XRE-family HTH domain [Kitasatospora sp. MAP12-15]|uniref:helix-turn-helix domain-containing protein n=1 Tax=unclassified Kitasatospora TaxID=2633591 RepID=UPI0024732ECB|nr:helix-turn-helix transcriptional regulator [Kitasatospora sp. MAP12-44]MDH6112572.1 transcriptional regulator with XRE-family HTH domain [Kitasatospora sp. MAP12-44]